MSRFPKQLLSVGDKPVKELNESGKVVATLEPSGVKIIIENTLALPNAQRGTVDIDHISEIAVHMALGACDKRVTERQHLLLLVSPQLGQLMLVAPWLIPPKGSLVFDVTLYTQVAPVLILGCWVSKRIIELEHKPAPSPHLYSISYYSSSRVSDGMGGIDLVRFNGDGTVVLLEHASKKAPPVIVAEPTATLVAQPQSQRQQSHFGGGDLETLCAAGALNLGAFEKPVTELPAKLVESATIHMFYSVLSSGNYGPQPGVDSFATASIAVTFPRGHTSTAQMTFAFNERAILKKENGGGPLAMTSKDDFRITSKQDIVYIIIARLAHKAGQYVNSGIAPQLRWRMFFAALARLADQVSQHGFKMVPLVVLLSQVPRFGNEDDALFGVTGQFYACMSQAELEFGGTITDCDVAWLEHLEVSPRDLAWVIGHILLG